MAIDVLRYDPAWAEQFRAEAAKLSQVGSDGGVTWKRITTFR